MTYSRALFLAPVLLVALACSDDVTGPAAACTDDTGAVSVSVSDAAQPVVTWDPACSVALLLIEEDASDQWGISTDDSTWDDPVQANLISPPVTYGVVPSDTEQFGPPEPLRSGVVYEVILWRVLTPGNTATCLQRFEDACLIAIHEFTR